MASKSNTPGVGGEFEILVPAYFALLLNNISEIKNFTFESNASEKFGNLDDVVIHITLKNGEQIHFAMQLKTHTDKNLQHSSLEADSGKFSLKKYCKCFKEIEGNPKNDKLKDYHFILFTNANFDREKKKENEEEKTENEKKKTYKFEINHYTKKDTQDIFNKILQDFNTSTKNNKNNIYTFKVIKENNVQNNGNATTSKENHAQSNGETPTNGAINVQNNEETPSNDTTNVQNNEETPSNDTTNVQNNEESSTNGAINAHNNEEAPTNGAINAQSNETTPTNVQSNEETVTTEDFERFFSKLFLFVSQPNFSDFQQSIRDILKEETIYLKYVNLFREWHQGKFTNKKIDKKTLNSHLVNFFLSSLLIRTARLDLGLFNTVAKEFDLSIVNSSFETLKEGLGKPEANFSLQRIRDYMKEYEIDVQGLANDPERGLLRLAKEWKFVIGSTDRLDDETKLKILQYFFEEPIILEFSDKSSKKLVCLLLDLYKMEDNRIKLILLGQDFDNQRFPKLSVFENLAHLDFDSVFFRRNLQCCQISIQGRTIKIKDLIERHPKIIEWVKAIEIFQMLKGDYTVGIEEFKKLPNGTFNIKSKSSEIFKNIPKGLIKIKAVCTETGLGKSVMLQHLKNICPLFYWIRGHTFNYYKEISDVGTFLSNSLKLRGQEKNIENFYLKGKQVAIFFDELDAVSSDNLKNVFDYINELYEQKYVVFVAARKCLLTKIRNHFGDSVEIIDIEKLTKIEQEEYIRGKVEDFIDNFFENESIYFGIPLFLTSEKLLEKLKKLKSRERIPDFTLCSIYFKVLHQHLVRKIEAEISNPDSLVTDMRNDYIYGNINMLQQNYEYPALQFLFGDEIFDKLKIQDKRLFQSYLLLVEKYNDPLGILNLDDDGKVVFEHASLAEYFAGNYFANNSDKFKLLNDNELGDDKKILEETYTYNKGIEKSGNRCRIALSA